MAYSVGSLLVRAVMSNVTGLVEDQVVNDFAFDGGASVPTDPNLEAIMSKVDDFYRDDTAGGNNVGEFISSSIDRAATHELQIYRITATGTGSPLLTTPWLGPPTPLSTTNAPNEVAAVLSFHAELTGVLEESGGTRPKARRRGRVYIGPITDSAVAMVQPNPVLDSGFLTILRQAAVRLMDDALALGYPWCVWSRRDQLLRPVVGGWTDNAPDTQRRRGQAATARVTWG